MGGESKLAEVALLELPLPRLPDDLGGELVLFVNTDCVDDPSRNCLFAEYGWAVRLADGRFKLPDDGVVESLPATSG